MRLAVVRDASAAAERVLPFTAPLPFPPAPPGAPSDESLIVSLRQGDMSALDMMLARYWTLVVDYIARLVGAPDVAEDVVQRTFCQLWDRRTRWSDTGSLRALLCRVARNIAISEQRRDGARQRSAAVFAMSRRATPTPVDELETEQLRLALDRAIAALPDRRREIFILRCVHDLSYKEIADVLDVAPQTVANQLSSALRTLRETLGQVLD